MSTVLEKPKRRTKKPTEVTLTDTTKVASADTTKQTNTVIVPKKGRPKKAAPVDTQETTKPKKEKKEKKQTKETIPSPVIAPTPPILVPEHIETNDEPLSVDSVEFVKLTSFVADGTEFYREPIKNKLFKQNKDGSIGPYVGRWSTKEAKIYEDIPDSDRE
jgi:hypothetical protein